MSCSRLTSLQSQGRNSRSVEGSSEWRKFTVTYRWPVVGGKTVQAITEDSGSRDGERGSPSAFLPALAWYKSPSCAPHFSSALRCSALSTRQALTLTTTGSPSEWVCVVCVREGGRAGHRGSIRHASHCVSVWVRHNVKKSTPHKTHQHRQQPLVPIVLQPGLTVAVRPAERQGERGKKGGELTLLCLWGGLTNSQTHTRTRRYSLTQRWKENGGGRRHKQDGV